MEQFVGGMGCDSAGNPLGSLVDGFLDRARVAEQMGEGMAMNPAMAQMNMANMAQTMGMEGAGGLGMFAGGMGADSMVNDFMAMSAQQGDMAMMDQAMAQAGQMGPSLDDFANFQAAQVRRAAPARCHAQRHSPAGRAASLKMPRVARRDLRWRTLARSSRCRALRWPTSPRCRPCRGLRWLTWP